MLGVTPLQLFVGRCMRWPCKRVFGGEWCGAGGLAWPAEWWEEWLLWVAEGALELVGRPMDWLGVAAGAAMPVRISHNDLL